MSASVRAPEIGASIPKGYRVRQYRASDHDELMRLQLRNHMRWQPGRDPSTFEFLEPDDPTCLGVVVLADENDRPVAAVGAQVVAEIGTVIDGDRISIFTIRDVMLEAWAKLAVHLFKKGQKVAFCRVSSPTPGWVNMLKRRLKFQPSTAPHLYFDLDKTLSDPALRELYDSRRVQ